MTRPSIAKLGIEGPEKLHKVVPPLFEFPERDLRELGDLVEQSDAPSAIQSFARSFQPFNI